GRSRRIHSAVLVQELEAAFSAFPFAEIRERLDGEDLVWAPVQTPAEVVADPQVAAAGGWVDVEDGQGGSFRSPAAPARFPGADASLRPAPPTLGQHTREVLGELGYSGEEIEALYQAGAAA
ncbi:MAG: CoA transferase, partial [Phenylobacterium sp.]